MKRGLIGTTIILLTIFFILIFLTRGIPEINTEYTKDFSYRKFSQVKNEMTKDQVEQILGEPFKIWEPGYECWEYSRGNRKINGWIFNGWVSVQVCFKDDRVIDTPRSVF